MLKPNAETPRNVVHVIRSLPVGGVETLLQRVLPQLPRDRYVPRLCVLQGLGIIGEELKATGFPVDFVPVTKRTHPVGLLRLARYFRRVKADIVHTHMYSTSVTGTIAATLGFKRIPVITHNHAASEINTTARAKMEARLDRWRNLALTVSNASRSELLRMVPSINPDRIRVLHNTAGTLPRDIDPQAMRKKLGIPAENIVFGIVARISQEKCIPLLIKCFADVLATTPNANLIIVGGGGALDECRQLAAQLQIEKSVCFAGEQLRVQDYYSIFNVFCLPSVREAFGLVLVEAMQFGVPIVATAVGGIVEVVRDNVDGILVEPNNQPALANAMLTMAQDANLRTTMGHAARERANEFSPEKYIEELCDIYDSLF